MRGGGDKKVNKDEDKEEKIKKKKRILLSPLAIYDLFLATLCTPAHKNTYILIETPAVSNQKRRKSQLTAIGHMRSMKNKDECVRKSKNKIKKRKKKNSEKTAKRKHKKQANIQIFINALRFTHFLFR